MPGSTACVCLRLIALLLVPLRFALGADEFVGPLGGWDNVRNYAGVVGDGAHDDTAGIQAALDNLGRPGRANVLYIPAGTYRITQQLSYASIGANAKSCQILGEDPADTVLVWGGPADGTMLDVDSDWEGPVIGRLTFDGKGIAGTGCWWWTATFCLHDQLMDSVFKNMKIGLRLCDHPGEGAEANALADSPVMRCQFHDCTAAGISQSNPNTLNISVWYSLFERCGVGITDAPVSAPASPHPDGNTVGHGNIQCYSCVFLASTRADACVVPDNYNTMRGCYSLGSTCFVRVPWNGTNTCSLTVVDNVVLDCATQPIDVACNGPLLLLDNVFGYSAGTVAHVGVDATGPTGQPATGELVSVGNTYCVADPLSVNGVGRLTRLDDQTAQGPIVRAQPILPATPPNRHRHIIELAANADGAAIQAGIDEAFTHYLGQHPVVHIPAGEHPVSSTITVPAGCDVQLVGDGMNRVSHLYVDAHATPTLDTMLRFASPCRASLRHLTLDGAGVCDKGIVAGLADIPEDRVLLDQFSVNTQNLSYQHTWADVVVDGLGEALVDAQGLYLEIGGTSNGYGIQVIGRGAAQDRGRTIIMPANAGEIFKGVYNVQNGARLLVADAWDEMHPDDAPTFMDLRSGSGSFTLLGGLESTCPRALAPGIDIGAFSGTVSLLNLIETHCSSAWPAAGDPTQYPNNIRVRSDAGADCRILTLGAIGDVNLGAGMWDDQSASAAFACLHAQFTVFAGAAYSGHGPVPDRSNHADPVFLRGLLHQARTEKPSAWPLAESPPGASDLRLSRVLVCNMQTLGLAVCSDAALTPPTITACTTATPGDVEVRLTGSNFTHATSVLLDGRPVPFTVTTPDTLILTVPAGTLGGTVSVTTPFGTVSRTGDFTAPPAHADRGGARRCGAGGMGLIVLLIVGSVCARIASRHSLR